MTRAPLTLALLATILVISGCTSAEQAPAPPSTSVSTTRDTSSPVVSEPQLNAASDPAVGPVRASEAWSFGSDFAARWAYSPTLMAKTPQAITAGDFEGLRQVMTKRARAEWDEHVNNLPNPTDQGEVNCLAYHGLVYDGYTVPDPARSVSNFTIRGKVTSGGGVVSTIQTQEVTIHVTNPQGERVKFTITKSLTLRLAENPSGGWLVDDWECRGDNGEITPDA